MTHYEEQIHKRLERFIPEHAVKNAFLLWKEAPFRFVISKERSTKLGDFRRKPHEQDAIITINKNLNPFAFLITFIHEVAHHWVYNQYKGRVAAHGTEWKLQFKELMLPFQTEAIFPASVLSALNNYMRNPKAASLSDIALATALQGFDNNQEDTINLSEISEGEIFELDKRKFQKIESRRTRVRCKEIKSGKMYLVHKAARVLKVYS